MSWQTYPELGERVYRKTLPNGLPVTVIPRPGFTRKIAYFVTNFGAVHTSFSIDGQPYRVPDGIAHYLEHKLFDMPGGEVSEEFAALGASVNAFTGYDMTAYYFSCTEQFDESLKLLLEFVTTPYFTQQSVDKERGIIAQEIGMNEDNPDSRGFEMLMQAMYREHPVRSAILGTRESIARITPENLTLTHRAFYRPDNMLLCVIGDVDPEQVCAIAQETVPAAPAETVTVNRDWQEDMTCREPKVEAKTEVAMTMFQLGFKCEPQDHGIQAIRQELIGDLAAEALFGESSGLYLRLYEQGLIDNSFGGGYETVDGMAMLTASGDCEEPEQVKDAILQEAQRLIQEGIPQEDFVRMKRSAMGRRVRDLDSMDSTCFRMCACELIDFDYFTFPAVYSQIQQSDVLEFLGRVVTQPRCAICVLKENEYV